MSGRVLTYHRQVGVACILGNHFVRMPLYASPNRFNGMVLLKLLKHFAKRIGILIELDSDDPIQRIGALARGESQLCGPETALRSMLYSRTYNAVSVAPWRTARSQAKHRRLVPASLGSTCAKTSLSAIFFPHYHVVSRIIVVHARRWPTCAD